MSDLVKRAHVYANDPMWANHCEVPKAFMREMADEIERLEKERMDALNKRDAMYSSACSIVLDDMREWLQRQGVATVMAEKWLDAYEKDMK